MQYKIQGVTILIINLMIVSMLLAQLSDLRCHHVSIYGEPPVVGYSVEMENSGDVYASSFYLYTYLIDYYGGSSVSKILIDEVFIDELGANSFLNIRGKTVNISDVSPGDYGILCVIDATEVVVESNEDNNDWFGNGHIIVPLPPPPTQADLTVTSFHVIDSEGPDIACKLTVENEGSESTSSEFKNIVYLSQDKTITNTDYRVADWNVTESLAPGESKTSWNLSFAVSDVPAGEYYLGAMADAYNNINESDENNNTKCANSPMVNIPEGYEDPVEPEDPEEPEGNIITNWQFYKDMLDWIFNVMNTGNGSCSIEDDVFHAQITSGGTNVWDVDLQHQDIMLVYGNTYTASFRAKAASTRNIQAWARNTTAPQLIYGIYPYTLTTDWQTFTYSFFMVYPTDPTARVGFDFGTSDVDVDIDCFSLVEETPEVPDGPEVIEDPEGNMITNWNFGYDMDGWQFSTMNAGYATGTVMNGVFYGQIINGGSNLWDVRLYQDDITIENGKTYTGSFSGKAAGQKTVWASVGMIAEPFITYNADWEFSLSTEWQTYTLSFTMGYSTDTEARMTFNLGASNTDVYLDNISLVEVASSTYVNSDILSQAITTFDLAQNFPNPFNPYTAIGYRIPEPCFVLLKVYDLLGQEVGTLVNESLSPGEYSVTWDGSGCSAGIYLLRLTAGDFTDTKKLILQK